MTEYSPDYLAFIELANEGNYREALLRLEEVWKEERSEFYAGLLQLMVALNQMRGGMRPTRTLRRARERIAPFAPRHAGLDVASLLATIAHCEALLQRPAPPGTDDLPTLHLTLKPDHP